MNKLLKWMVDNYLFFFLALGIGIIAGRLARRRRDRKNKEVK